MMPEFLLPFGPFHMVLLHLPIGALAAIWFVELFSRNDGKRHKNPSVTLLHLFLVITCGLSILIGLAYAEFGDYGEDVADHEFWGYVFGVCVLLAAIAQVVQRFVAVRALRVVYFILLIASTVSMVITGHQGGEMVHGKGFLTKPFKKDTRERPATEPAVTSTAPEPQPAHRKPEASTAAKTLLDELVDEATSDSMEVESMDMEDMSMDMMAPQMDDVPMPDMMAAATPPQATVAAPANVLLFEEAHTIFKNHCFNCHGATKQKGDYRLDNPSNAYEGGKSKLAAIVPGAPEDSEILYRMRLRRSHDDTMPPEKKEPVSAEGIAKIEAWIQAGAIWPSETQIKEAPREHVEVGDADTTALLENISATGAKAEYNAWGDDSVRVDLSVARPDELETALQSIDPLAEKLVWLDLSHLELPKGTIEKVSKFQKLQRLHLDGSNVTDAQLVSISQLPELQFLNIYNTQISDTGLASLKQSRGLTKLVLTNSQVTQSGINKLKKAKPDLEVIYQ